MFSSAGDISGYTIDDGIANIDLQTAPEATAADGNSSGDISIYIRANVDSPPTTPADTTDYNTVDGSFTLPTNWVRTQADTTGENPIWESTAAFFGTGILTLDWQEPVRIEGTDVTVTDDGGTVTIDDGENDIDIDRPIVVTIDPPVVTLGANYRGVTSGSRTVTVGVTQGSLTYTYDGTTPFANRTFRIDNVVNGNATVSRTDGTFTITATTADTQVVTFDVIIMSNTGTSITVATSFDVLRNTATREIPVPMLDRNLVRLEADYRAGVISNQSETVTATVGGFAYDADGELGVDTFRLSVAADGGASVTNNNDGTISITNLPSNQDSAIVQLQFDYRDHVCLLYTSPSPRDS